MRWLFLILVLLNGVLYAWFVTEQQARELRREQARPDHSGLDTLALLSEVPADQLKPRQVPEELAAEVPVEEPLAPDVCYRVGEFEEARAAGAFVDVLGNGTLQAQVTKGLRPLAPDHWVYVQAPAGGLRVESLRRTLRVDGLDSYLVRQGPLSGQLSIGLYRNKESAEALLAALLDKGYPAKMFLKERFEPIYFVDIRTKASQEWHQRWQRKLAPGNPGLKNEKKSCEGVASEQGAE
ncbi:hypothetical protein [Motiliproteus sp. SC1-56]|uniref:hypothetical protein n=1 Tax=Motiliproteus sp. SC1-56 TaxID=2799565 RepID=UPI001A8F32C8|nr:hypothetical protein [Motiliproteus sp. SC1-56]